MKKTKILIAGLLLMMVFGQTCYAAEEYVWSSVPYGGGGYVTGLVTHPADAGLVYARTDVGGAYRWNNGEWILLTGDFTDGNLFGIAGMAVDPNNTDVVYMAAGKYNWKNCDVFKSTDRGETWVSCHFPKSFFANGSQRDGGECIAVSPVDSNLVYVGTYDGGLWKSSDGGATWQAAAGVPHNAEVVSLVFDGSVLYASAYNDGVYRIENDVCEKLEGSPATIKRMAVSDSGLFLAGDALYRYRDGAITRVSLPSSTVSYVSAVAASGNFVVAAANTGNLMKFPIYYSEDGGATWHDSFRLEQHTSTVPWLRNEWFSSATACVAIDSSDSKKVMFSDWFGVWKTDDVTASRTQWTNPMKGIEEGVPFAAVSTPSGARLLVAMADTDGARYEDFYEYPETVFGNPRLQSTTSIDFCESNPNYVARVGVTSGGEIGDGGYSTDNGATWTTFAGYPKNTNGENVKSGKIAVASEMGENGHPVLLLLAVDGPAYRSTDGGATWNRVEGYPAQSTQEFWSWKTRLVSDRTNGSRFYAAADDGLYTSDDAGVSWTKQSTINFAGLKSDYSRADAVWGVSASGELYHSENGGASFTKISGFSDVVGFDFGKPRASHLDATVYVCGTLNGSYGVYKSDDNGLSFSSISDNAKNINNEAGFITADRQKYGVVYVGTNGTGVMRAERRATADVELNEDFENITELPATWETTGVCKVEKTSPYNSELVLGNWAPGAMAGKAIYKGAQMEDASYRLQFDGNNQGGSAGNLFEVYFNYHESNGQVSAYQLQLYGGDNGGAQLVKLVNGEPSVLASADKTSAHRSSQYTIAYNYGSIKVSQNGAVVFEVVDERPISPGYIGFASVSSVVNMDNVRMQTPDFAVVSQKIYSEDGTVPQSLYEARGSTLTAELETVQKDPNVDYSIWYTIHDESLQSSGVSNTDTFKVQVPANVSENSKLWFYFWDASMRPMTHKIRGL